MQKGTIGVTTENIFPIIKKFLYSDHEIFLRELVANAVDATQKMKALANTGEFKGELGDISIRVKSDKEKGTITSYFSSQMDAYYGFRAANKSPIIALIWPTGSLPECFSEKGTGKPGMLHLFRRFFRQPIVNQGSLGETYI